MVEILFYVFFLVDHVWHHVILGQLDIGIHSSYPHSQCSCIGWDRFPGLQMSGGALHSLRVASTAKIKSCPNWWVRLAHTAHRCHFPLIILTLLINIIHVGIANALDLTDRVLPRLHSYTCQPQLLHFAPYTIKQIVTIMQKWLDSEETNAVIDPMAMQFCACKVAASNGDLRKAFDVCR